MEFKEWIANKGGKTLRATAKYGGKAVRFSSKLSGAAIELAGEGTGKLVSLIHERSGDTIKKGAKTIARAVETPAEVTTRTVEQLVNKITGKISELAGDTEGEAEAFVDELETREAMGAHIDDLRENAEGCWKGLTAQKMFDQAKAKFNKLKQKQKTEQARIDGNIKKYNSETDECLSKINICRSQADELFRQFEILSNAFANWQVKNHVFAENFAPKQYTLDRMPSCSEIFSEVNFDEDPIWTNLKGIFTLGFWNERKIKEAQDKISTMEIKILPEAIKKGDMEISRCQKITTSLKFVEENFTFFIDFYRELLQELEYSIHLVRNAGYMRNMCFFNNTDEKLSPYFLPERHIRCLQACDKLSRLLCELAKRKYFNDSTIEIIENDIKRVEKYSNRIIIPLKQSLAA